MLCARARFGALTALVAVATGCAPLIGIEEFTGGAPDAGRERGSISAQGKRDEDAGDDRVVRDADVRDDPCGPAGARLCIDDAPAEWSGPVALATGPSAADAPSCQATGYERRVLSLFGGLDAGSANCGCSCSAPSDMSCAQTISLWYSADPLACIVALDLDPLYTLAAGECRSPLNSGSYMAERPAFIADACTPERTAEIVPAVWTQRVVACATNEGTSSGCEGAQHCLPALADPLEAWCIHRDGEHDCPVGAYAERSVYYADLEDDRSCTPCSCSAATGECSGRVSFSYFTPNLNGGTCPGLSLEATLPLGDCITIDAVRDDRIAMLGTITPEGKCEAAGGDLQGAVTPGGAVTFCCRPSD